MDVDI